MSICQKLLSKYHILLNFIHCDIFFGNQGCNLHLLSAQNTVVTSLFYLHFMLIEQKQVRRNKRETVSPPPAELGAIHSVPPGVPFYLSCPIDSYHAVYTWDHGGQSSPCLQMLSNCLLLIPVMAKESYGNYTCVSKEKDYTKVVKHYHITEQVIPDTRADGSNPPYKISDASAVVPQIWLSLGMAVTLMGIGRGCA